MSNSPDDKRDQEGFIRNPRTGHWWREPGNGATENKDEAHGYTREQFDVLAAAMPNLEFHPLAPVSFAAGIITAEPITTYAELEAAYQKAILGRHISEIAPVLALRNKALDSFFAPSSIEEKPGEATTRDSVRKARTILMRAWERSNEGALGPIAKIITALDAELEGKPSPFAVSATGDITPRLRRFAAKCRPSVAHYMRTQERAAMSSALSPAGKEAAEREAAWLGRLLDEIDSLIVPAERCLGATDDTGQKP